MHDPWLIGGDFNAIAAHNEHQGRSMPHLNSMMEFSNCVAACDLIEPNYSGPTFTWAGVRSNGWVWRRLDRYLINSRWNDLFKRIQIDILDKTPSDHTPILIRCSTEETKGPRSFKFHNMWLKHLSFLDTVQKSWSKSPSGGGMRGSVYKLQCLQNDLRLWNKETFGNIFEEIRKCEDQVMQVEKSFMECQ
ncbi:unnamed protein product [Cuscuta epithymum]|uniref:Endonuclease/exonuclease/phosphatase domain-containing protein n=1 Tax=Cuscuta epithymum TaxID=186058 RepID=A0AAV0FSL6_9ASTE|nr:unnamed protein product [Cuscuta epithymum]CAH9138437.1 unnamed protein product [Cuscuta epithymum]